MPIAHGPVNLFPCVLSSRVRSQRRHNLRLARLLHLSFLTTLHEVVVSKEPQA